MAETLRIRQAKGINDIIISSFLVLAIFLFWLALSANNLVGLAPAAFGLGFVSLASVMIRRPFELVLSDEGLLMKTPFGDSFFNWSNFQGFSVKYADPFTKHVVIKLEPDVDLPKMYKVLRAADYGLGLYPFFEIKSDELIKVLRRYRYGQGSTRSN